MILSDDRVNELRKNFRVHAEYRNPSSGDRFKVKRDQKDACRWSVVFRNIDFNEKHAVLPIYLTMIGGTPYEHTS